MDSARSHAPLVRRHLAWGAEVFVALFLIWLALNGIAAWAPGLAFSALGALIGAMLAPGQASVWSPWRALNFAAYFLRESLRGGLDVAYRALHPRMPVQPHFVDYPMRLPAGPSRTLMVGLVSLLPGSLCADIDPSSNVLRAHLLAKGSGDGLDELEARIAALFGLELP